MRIIYLGTPQFAVKPLEYLLKSDNEVVAVVTQPDRVNGRGKAINPSPVKTVAEQNGVPVYQFEKIKAEGLVLKALNADIMVTCAYGQILSQQILDITKHGVINIHASLLPAYRGSSPVQWAIRNGEKTIGVTVMQTALGIDCGDIIKQKSVEITDETTEEALELLSGVGAELVVEVISELENGTAVFVKQDEALATHYPMLKKEDGMIDFSLSAEATVNTVRAFCKWPSCYFHCTYGTVKILKARVSLMEKGGAAIGEVMESSPKKGLHVACGSGVIEILEMQAENSKAMSASAFLAGKPVEKGSILK